jgi:hypothetical protein
MITTQLCPLYTYCRGCDTEVQKGEIEFLVHTTSTTSRIVGRVPLNHIYADIMMISQILSASLRRGWLGCTSNAAGLLADSALITELASCTDLLPFVDSPCPPRQQRQRSPRPPQQVQRCRPHLVSPIMATAAHPHRYTCTPFNFSRTKHRHPSFRSLLFSCFVIAHAGGGGILLLSMSGCISRDTGSPSSRRYSYCYSSRPRLYSDLSSSVVVLGDVSKRLSLQASYPLHRPAA